jgi:predicted DNA-binding transcriptional regulator YafY
MRADRLLALLMLLQARGRMTAGQLAEALEVSARTVYRDLDALSAAGVPVYAERGPGGGCALLDGYRTSLTGLTGDEVRALFMLSVPAALEDLGLSGELRAAMRKLAAALPPAQRGDDERVAARIHLDWSGWGRRGDPAPQPSHLEAMQAAVWEDRCLAITYRAQVGPHVVEFEAAVEPYGLVAQAGVWHLVARTDGVMQVYRASQVTGVKPTAQRFSRRAGFVLAAFWQAWRAGQEEQRPVFIVTVRVAPALAPYLPFYFGDAIRAALAAAPRDAEGWATLPLAFERFEEARERILGFGAAVEVIAPLAVRLSIIDFAQQIVAYYGQRAR